jgi:hypothetical protein
MQKKAINRMWELQGFREAIASNVEIALAFRDRGLVQLRVHDDGKGAAGADSEWLIPHHTLVSINRGHMYVDELPRRNHHDVALALQVDFVNGSAVNVLDHRLQPQDLVEQAMSVLFRPSQKARVILGARSDARRRRK